MINILHYARLNDLDFPVSSNWERDVDRLYRRECSS